TLIIGSIFINICDSSFPSLKRVRVFSRLNYLSYLGIKHRLSRIIQSNLFRESPNIDTGPQLLYLIPLSSTNS
ncbi:hypothetical protein BDF14DRAFT_1721335, partial [Spinellus fusiger]